MGALRIGALDAARMPAWDHFVHMAPGATFFHRAGWKTVIERSFGHDCHYLYVERDEQITGVLPLVHIRSVCFGNALISTAFAVIGGPAAVDDESSQALDDAARDLAETLDVDYLEYRLSHPSERGWPSERNTYATFEKPLAPDPEKSFTAVPRKRRAELRKAMKRGLVSRLERDVGNFFSVYGESVRNLGTPVFARRYFRELLQVFGEDSEILTVFHGEQPVSSVLSFYFDDKVLPYYGGGTQAARGLAGNDFMYWEVMRRATGRGIGIFDFGRSKSGTGAFAYKKTWGFEPRSLSYEYLLRRRTELPNINPLNPKYRLFIALWKLLPLPVANTLGPRISRNLG